MTPPQLWQHTVTGKRYIVLLHEGEVTRAAGPLSNVDMASIQWDEWTAPYRIEAYDYVKAHQQEFAVVWPQEGEA